MLDNARALWKDEAHNATKAFRALLQEIDGVDERGPVTFADHARIKDLMILEELGNEAWDACTILYQMYR